MPESAPIAPIEPDARILVINVARIGDTLMLTPILRALKLAAPHGELACIAHPGRAAVLRHLPFLDRLIPMTKLSAPLKGWFARGRWDYAVVYGNDRALLRYALRAARRVVAFRQTEPTLNAQLFHAVPRPQTLLHGVAERALLAQALSVDVADPRLAYVVTADEGRAAQAWRARHIAPNAWPLVALHPASFPTKAYRDWPLDAFTQLGKAFAARWPDAAFVITGGPEDRARADKLAAQLGPRAVPYAGQGTLRQTAAILAGADLYVGIDTGLTHLAGALGVAMVALYHCLHRGSHLAPLHHPRLRVIEHPRTDADCGEQSSMAEIRVETVFTAASELLAQKASRAC